MIRTTRNTNNTSFINDDDIEYILTHDLTSELSNMEAQLDNKVNKTGNESIAGNKTFNNNVLINGNLTVDGTQTTVNVETMNLEDNLIRLNVGQTGTPPEHLISGVEVTRGDEPNYNFVFEESTDLFKIGMADELQAVATRDDTLPNNDIPKWNATDSKLVASGVNANNLTGLSGNVQTQLNGKTNTGHIHAISDITDLQTQLNGKSNTGHIHTISDITDLQTQLNSKINQQTFNGYGGNGSQVGNLNIGPVWVSSFGKNVGGKIQFVDDGVKFSNSLVLDYDFANTASNQDVAIRFFRNTNTTGNRELYLHTGDGTNAQDITFRVGGGNSYINSGNLGVGLTNPLEKLHVGGNIRSDKLTANTVLVADTNKNITSSNVLNSTLSYLDATSSIQTQLNSKANDSAVVKLTGSQSIGGTKTFTGGKTNFNTDSNEAGYIRTSGEVGSDDKLRIVGPRGNGGIQFGVSSNLTNAMFLNSSGQLGIGVPNPQARLHIDGNFRYDGATSTNRVLVTDGSKNVISSSITNTELGYLSGATSNIQTQINNITGSTIGLTADRALISNSSGAITASSITNTELGYLSGATSSIQNQINTKVPDVRYSAAQDGALSVVTNPKIYSGRSHTSTGDITKTWASFGITWTQTPNVVLTPVGTGGSILKLIHVNTTNFRVESRDLSNSLNGVLFTWMAIGF